MTLLLTINKNIKEESENLSSFMYKKAPHRCDFVTCWSRRWVSASINPFPAGEENFGGYTSIPDRVNSPFYKKCRNKIEHPYRAITL